MAKAKKKKAKKAARAVKAKKAPMKKNKAKKSGTKKVKAKAGPAKKKPVKAKAKKAAPKKAAAKKPAPKPPKVIGEGDYQASRAFLKDQAGFVKKNKASIPELGRQAEMALDGPEGDSLRAAEAEAASRAAE